MNAEAFSHSLSHLYCFFSELIHFISRSLALLSFCSTFTCPLILFLVSPSGSVIDCVLCSLIFITFLSPPLTLSLFLHLPAILTGRHSMRTQFWRLKGRSNWSSLSPLKVSGISKVRFRPNMPPFLSFPTRLWFFHFVI